MDDLKPCPFCGPGNSIVEYYQDPYDYHIVGCGRCGSHSGTRPKSNPDGKAKVIASWNSRPEEEALLSKLRKIVDYYPGATYDMDDYVYDLKEIARSAIKRNSHESQ